MGVVRESARSVVSRNINELNEVNDLLSSDTDQQIVSEERKVRRKKKSSGRHNVQIYSCRKSNDLFLKELSAELGIDSSLQDITPEHNSPLSSLFDDPAKMKIWLVFIDSNDDVQDKMLHPEVEMDCQRRYKKISKSLRAELNSIPVKTVKQFEDLIYSTLAGLGYEGVVVLSANTPTERVVIVAISQYSRLRSMSHLPINTVEIELKKKSFVKPTIPLSQVLSI